MEANTGEDDRAGQTARALAKSQCRQRYYCTQILGLGGSPGITFGKAVVAMSPGTPPKPLHPSMSELSKSLQQPASAQSDCRLSTVQPPTSHLPRKTAHSHGACSAILGVAVGDLGPSGRLL